MRQRTLENYCHDTQATPQNRLNHGCPLFKTKPDDISQSLSHAIDTAETFRKYKELNLLPTLDIITAYEYACYDAADTAVRKTQDDIQREEDKKQERGNKHSGNKTGGQGGEVPFKADKMGQPN